MSSSPGRDTRRAFWWSSRVDQPLRGFQLGIVHRLNRPHELDAGGFADPIVVMLAPRRIGKSTAVLMTQLGRMYERRGYMASYTAQTGHAVTEVFGEPGVGWIDLTESAGVPGIKCRRSQGTERITYRRPGRRPSFLAAFPPVPGRKLRGRTRHAVTFDEAQELDDVGSELLADAQPTGDTLGHRRQIIVTGTAGYGPGWWLDLVQAARAGEHGLIELGTWPDDADPDDESVWREHHPGLIAGLTTIDSLRAARRILGADRFAREYGNRWGQIERAARPFDPARWDELRAEPGSAARAAAPAAAGFDVTLDRDRVDVAGVTLAGHVRLLASGPVEQLAALLARHARGVPVYCPPNQAPIAGKLTAAGAARVTTLTLTEYRAACQLLADRVKAGQLSHDAQPELTSAVELAERSWAGDSWVLSARKSGGNVSPLVAAAVAVHGASTARRPRVVTGSGT